jgi:Xaa-Pro aminopeptidase
VKIEHRDREMTNQTTNVLKHFDFELTEYEGRIERVRRLMTEERLDAILVTSEFNHRYLSGFTTQFWRSPTRPWYFVIPRVGAPQLIVPSQGVENIVRTSWVDSVLTFPSPNPDNEGIDLVVDALRSSSGMFGRIGFEIGAESRIGITIADFQRIAARISPATVADTEGLLRRARQIKSPAEIAKIARACALAGDGYDTVADHAQIGQREDEIVRALHVDLIRRGLDKAPYLIGCSGPGGYPDGIMGPTDKRIEAGDVMIIDTGSVFDGYYCDFNRNWAFGHASDEAKRAYELCWQATEAGLAALRPGAKASDLFLAQAKVLETASSGWLGTRMGHGLGIQMTETPSNRIGDDTILEVGMVLTIEPGMFYGPRQLMLHEEDAVITDSGVTLLTRRAPRELPVIAR